jgi:hypothetical protein
MELRAVMDKKDDAFTHNSLSFVRSIDLGTVGVKDDITDKTAKLVDDTVNVFAAKLAEDVKEWELFLEKAVDLETASAEEKRQYKLTQKKRGLVAAETFMQGVIHVQLSDTLDSATFLQPLNQQLREQLVRYPGIKSSGILIIVDCNMEEKWSADLARATTILKMSPEIACCLVLMPWSPEHKEAATVGSGSGSNGFCCDMWTSSLAVAL